KEIVEKARKKLEKARVAFTCDECFRVFSGQLYCPDCGQKITISGKMKDYVEADLVSITSEEFDTIEERITEVDQQRFYLACLYWCRAPRTKNRIADRPAPRRDDSFASVMFRNKFGACPPWDWRKQTPMKTSVETANYIPVS